MNTFKEFQFATIIFLIAIPAQIYLVVIFITQAGTRPMTFTSLGIANAVFIIIYLLFYGMRTRIDNDYIRVSYGIGVIQKKIKLININTVSVVSNPWYYGWGIRLIPNGWLYNINGTSGIELTFKNTSRIIRIGSADARSLQKAIQSLRKV